jgi:Cd2+/Zn2+-exporting ATPase
MALRSLFCLVAAVVGWQLHDPFPNASAAAYMVAFLFGGWDLAQQVWIDVRELQFDTHFLMFLVVPGSVAVGAWGEGALLLILFSASATLEAFASHRTRREIDSLLRRAPKTARRITSAGEAEVPVEALLPGERIRITAGEQVPVDAEVMMGSSACDESSLTGEAVPVPKVSGDFLFSGTLNLWGVMDARVLRAASDSALQRIIRLIEKAQELKAPVQRFTDRFGTRYTALVLLACGALFLWTALVQHHGLFKSTPGQPSAFYRAMTLLVVLSPCALVLSVPSAILSAIAFGARTGILFRGGAAIENLAGIQLIALDKTGTLTRGELEVVTFEPLLGDPETARAAAAALARISNHPVARSIHRNLRNSSPPPDSTVPQAEASETIPGRGVRARWKNLDVIFGHRDLVAPVAGLLLPELPPPSENTSETWVAGPGFAARFLLADTLRPETPATIAALHQAGIRTCMLTGDRPTAAARIAKESGVESFQAGLKPEDKVAALLHFRSSGLRVGMVGDGVNDAPVLSAADVGIAMGARGSDAAIEQADVVLMNDRLENLLVARQLSVRANRIIRQNLTVSLGTMILMGLLATFWPVLPLSLGVAAHEGSTVLVVMNSLRLLFNRTGAANTPNPTP